MRVPLGIRGDSVIGAWPGHVNGDAMARLLAKLIREKKQKRGDVMPERPTKCRSAGRIQFLLVVGVIFEQKGTKVTKDSLLDRRSSEGGQGSLSHGSNTDRTRIDRDQVSADGCAGGIGNGRVEGVLCSF